MFCRANQLFDLARSAAPPGGFSNSSIDYNTTAESWREQRAFITDAPKLLVSEQPALAAAPPCPAPETPTSCARVFINAKEKDGSDE